MLPRADVRDRLVGAASIEALPHGARIGTSSPRRAAQLRHLRPDVAIVPFRGNVDTRLRKLAEGEADATLLAAAGLDRLSRGDVGHAVPIDVMLPAPAQGAVGIEARADDARDAARCSPRSTIVATHVCVLAERALLAALGADCHSPMAALARIDGDDASTSRAELLSEDGAHRCADRDDDPRRSSGRGRRARRPAARAGAAGAGAAVHRAMSRTAARAAARARRVGDRGGGRRGGVRRDRGAAVRRPPARLDAARTTPAGGADDQRQRRAAWRRRARSARRPAALRGRRGDRRCRARGRFRADRHGRRTASMRSSRARRRDGVADLLHLAGRDHRAPARRRARSSAASSMPPTP